MSCPREASGSFLGQGNKCFLTLGRPSAASLHVLDSGVAVWLDLVIISQ